MSGGFTAAHFQPDGLLLGTGDTGNQVRIWDLKNQQVVAVFEGHTAPVTCVSFSESGTVLATADDAEVKLWDLRKLSVVASTTVPGGGVSRVRWDNSGRYLSVAAGNDVRVFANKTLAPIACLTGHTAPVTGACFTAAAQSIISTSMDRSLRVWSTAQ